MRGLLTLSVSFLLALGHASPILEPRGGGKGPDCYTEDKLAPKKFWLKDQEMWDHYLPRLLESNSEAEVHQIKHAIINFSDEAGLDRRVVFATMLRESQGDAHVNSGDGGISAGLMQIRGGETCFGAPKGGCSAHHIRRMIRDGIYGTADHPNPALRSDGLKASFERFGNYADALRYYNSGKLDLSVGLGTPSYVSDIANFLQGYEPPADCGFPLPISIG